MAKQDEVPETTTRVSLCGVQGCCPTVTVNRAAKEVVITDDFGGSVKLTTEEWLEAISNPKLVP